MKKIDIIEALPILGYFAVLAVLFIFAGVVLSGSAIVPAFVYVLYSFNFAGLMYLGYVIADYYSYSYES